MDRTARPPALPSPLATLLAGALLLTAALPACSDAEDGLAPSTTETNNDTTGDGDNNDDDGNNDDPSNNDDDGNNDTEDVGLADASDDAGEPSDAAEDVDPTDAPPDAPLCPLGEPCNPIPIEAFPYTDARDTREATSDAWDAYACSPDTDESGPEFVYTLQVESRSVLTASIDEVEGDGVDVDLHLLEALSPDMCTARDHESISAVVEPGRYWIAIDTWVGSDMTPLAGPYTLTVDLNPLPEGECAVMPVDLKMFWDACDPGLDCFEAEDDGTLHRFLRTPATGPVVKEAHLVTEGEDFPDTWPSASRDQIERHYQLSQDATGYAMDRTEAWAPAGEGGSMYGQGSTGRKIPRVAESWYVNMYWRERPDPGTRMIITNPDNGRAVVAAAGYETGPGANTAIGGVSEEVHHHLGTTHRDDLTLGFAADQSLPFGPIECE